MLNIVHCVTDQKFTKAIIEEFDFINDRCKNYYIIVDETPPRNFEYISSTDQKRINYLSKFDFLNYLEEIDCDIVIMHNFLSLPLSVIDKINPQITLVWFAWGFDLYESLADKPFVKFEYLYGPQTIRILNSFIIDGLRKKKNYIFKWFKRKRYYRAVNRVDFFSGVLPVEYDLMRKFPYFRAKRLNFTYVSPYLNISQELNKEEIPNSKNILIGNSGDPNNNHADIFNILRNYNIGDRKIYVPLSYGGTKRYRDKIKEIGYEIWGDSFVPIQNFMSFDEYRKVIDSCSFRIFGQERQQAMGNISIALWAGAKVFLSETSMAYSYLKSLGINVYTIQKDLVEERLNAFDDIQLLMDNRRKYVQHTLSASLRGKLDEMLDTLEKTRVK